MKTETVGLNRMADLSLALVKRTICEMPSLPQRICSTQRERALCEARQPGTADRHTGAASGTYQYRNVHIAILRAKIHDGVPVLAVPNDEEATARYESDKSQAKCAQSVWRARLTRDRSEGLRRRWAM
jgi:hypothetical protein